MHIIVMIALSLGLAVFYHFLISKLEYACATNAVYCDAEDAFLEFVFSNPGVYIGLSDRGKHLLKAVIDAHDEYMITHSFLNKEMMEKTRDYFLSFYDDLPPNSPADLPIVDEGARKSALSYTNVIRIITARITRYHIKMVSV